MTRLEVQNGQDLPRHAPMQKRLWTSLSLIATHAKISHLVASLPTLENHGNSGKCLEKSRIFGQIYQKICQRAQSHDIDDQTMKSWFSTSEFSRAKRPFSFVGLTYYVSKAWQNECRQRKKVASPEKIR